MGLRVRVVLVVLSLLAIAALAVPLALSLADRRTAALAAERGRQLAALADSAAMPDVPLERLVDRYHQVYGEGLLIVDSDGRTLAARGLSHSEPGVATAADHALVDAPASPWTRILPWDRRQRPGRRGCPTRRRAGRRRRGGGRHHGGGARRRQRLAVGGGRLSGSAGAGRAGRSCPHEVGAAPARRAGARGRRDDRRRRRAARRRGRTAGTAPLHVGVQHDGAGGAGLARPSTATRRRRVTPVAQSVGRRPVARGQPRRLRGRVGTVDIRFDDRGAGPSGESAAAAAPPGPRGGGQRQPQSGSVHRGGGVDGPRGRDRPNAWRSGSPSPTANTSDCTTARTIPGWRCSSLGTTSSSCSTSRWTTRCGTPGRTPRSPCRPRAPTRWSTWSSATTAPACPTRICRGPPHDSGGDATIAPERASGWRSPARSPRATAGRSRWSALPKAACWSATACRRQVNRL